jgi:hypothetical protein
MRGEARHRVCGRRYAFSPWIVILLLFPALPDPGETITGTVRNGTMGASEKGDEVILLRMPQMQEEARTITNSRGQFALNVAASGFPHVIRVVHQGIPYDQRASAGASLNIAVYDSAPTVPGVSGVAEIIRMDTRGKVLHVSEMYEIRNESRPARTQVSERTLEIDLPPGAAIQSTRAAGPSLLVESVFAVPVQGESGHYALRFPLRPGETRFFVNYDLPYRGRLVFQPRLNYAVQQLAIMFPETMTFESPAGYHPILSETGFQVQALNGVGAGDAPSFELSGEGVLPPLSEAGRTQAPLVFSDRARPPDETRSGEWTRWHTAALVMAAAAVVAFLCWRWGETS